MTLKIALLQIMPAGTLEENLKKGISCCRKAKEKGADIALFPEMWSNGYEISEDVNELKEMAVPADGDYENVLIQGRIAKEVAPHLFLLEQEKY